MRLFWKMPEEKEYTTKPPTEEEVKSAPTVYYVSLDENLSANQDHSNVTIDSKTAAQIREVCKLPSYFSFYNIILSGTCFVSSTVLWLRILPIARFLPPNFTGTAAILIGYSLALFHLYRYTIKAKDDGSLLELSRTQPKLVLPVLAYFCGNKHHREVSSQAKKGFILAFEKLGAEKCSSLLSRQNRQQLYKGLIKNIPGRNPERISPDDSAYCEAVLSLLELHPEKSALQSLENLARWAPWPLVERGRLIAMRLRAADSHGNQAQVEKEGMARLLYDLGSNDSAISQNAAERLRAINRQDIASLLALFQPIMSYRYLWYPMSIHMLITFISSLSYSPARHSIIIFTSLIVIFPLSEWLSSSHINKKRQDGKNGIHNVHIPWKQLIEGLQTAEDLEIVHELNKIPYLAGGISDLSRAARIILKELLPRVSESGLPLLDISHIHKELDRFPYFTYAPKPIFLPEDYQYFAAVAGVLAQQGNEVSMNHLRKLNFHFGFADLETQLDMEAISKEQERNIEGEDAEKYERIQLQIALNQAYHRIQERIGAGYQPVILLRPSSAPVKTETLLRPSGKGSKTSPGELLRPIDGQQSAVSQNDEQIVLQNRNQN